MSNAEPYPASFFQREDPGIDALFYAAPRRVVHIDEGAIAALSGLYARLLPPSGRFLDLMSSWRTHLPPSLVERSDVSVIGLGMNAAEMRDNPQLAEHVVHDLNAQPRLPFADAAFDAAVCAVSVQYLTRPVEVFADVARVLKPRSPFVVSFSNRRFPTKAVCVWLASSDEQHVALVTDYFRRAALWTEPQTLRHEPPLGDPLFASAARRA